MLRWTALAAAGLVLAGCVGEPRIYVRPRPVVARPQAAPARPAPAPAPRAAAPLSAAEKERLFREFQDTQASEP